MNNYIYNQMVYFTIMFDFTWSVSDCEDLVGEKNHTPHLK